MSVLVMSGQLNYRLRTSSTEKNQKWIKLQAFSILRYFFFFFFIFKSSRKQVIKTCDGLFMNKYITKINFELLKLNADMKRTT